MIGRSSRPRNALFTELTCLCNHKVPYRLHCHRYGSAVRRTKCHPALCSECSCGSSGWCLTNSDSSVCLRTGQLKRGLITGQHVWLGEVSCFLASTRLASCANFSCSRLPKRPPVLGIKALDEVLKKEINSHCCERFLFVPPEGGGSMFVINLDKSVTYVGNHFQYKSPIWFQKLMKYQRENVEKSLNITKSDICFVIKYKQFLDQRMHQVSNGGSCSVQHRRGPPTYWKPELRVTWATVAWCRPCSSEPATIRQTITACRSP